MLRITRHILLFVLLVNTVNAQVTLVSPTGAGGFELGGTFAANGWTDVQLGGGAANRWYVGTAAVNSGTRAVYISNDGGTNNTYNITQARTQHFYRDITFPAGTTSVTISFNWRNQGESCCDYITAYLEDVTFTPVAGTSNPTTNQIGTEYNVSSTWQSVSLNLNCGGYAGTTKRLIFSWRNDGSVGTDPPGAIDNISVVAQTSGSVCSYSVSSMTYGPDPFNSGTQLSFPDDQHSAPVNIGFPFCFNGVTYTQCVVSSNAYLSFDVSQSGSYSTWDTDPIPITTPAYLTNTIMFPWHDVDPSVSGVIRYNTLGTAPNRRFICTFRQVAMFDCTTLDYTGQVRLFEGTNIIQMHINDKTVCSTWNNEEAVEGINLSCGAVVVPGRNNTSWSATNSAHLFTPTGCCTVVLPVEGFEFTGEKKDYAHVLNWKTQTETNNDYFVLERSTDGEVFIPINRQDGAINSNSLRTYTFTDEYPEKGFNYYRLNQVNTDGTSKLSDWVVLEHVANDDVWVTDVYPNPANAFVNVSVTTLERENLTVEVYNMYGSLVSTYQTVSKPGDQVIKLDTESIAAGVYTLRVSVTGKKCVSAHRLVKN